MVDTLPSVFFDLDGTLVDPRVGITGCLRYALEKLGVTCPADAELTQFIGTPLRAVFARLLATDDATRIEAAVTAYRERYNPIGIFENTVYPGVPEMLTEFNERGVRPCLVTTKPKPYADIIVKHLGFDRWLADVFGTGLDGRYDDKADLVKLALATLKLTASKAVMVGDRNADIRAGKLNGMRTLGVTYGYGSSEELERARPDWVCHSPGDILRVLT
jgi:phosphoglycolate phosphatase